MEELKRKLALFSEEGTKVNEIEVSNYDDNLLEIGSNEYLVLTDEEADEKVKEYINDSVWAFNADFIISQSKILDYDEGSRKIIKAIQEQCESGNEAILKLIDDIDIFIEEAVSCDGRGHFLSTYDGNETEVTIKYKGSDYTYYVYRVN